MPQFGIYDPSNAENTSNLFSFQEVPVTSTKVNRWNANIASGFQLVQQVLSIITSQSGNAVFTLNDDTPLKTSAAVPEDMTVIVAPGWAVIQNSLAGVDQNTTLPMGGSFTAPASNPRIDLIVLRNTGQLDVITGTEASSPMPPSTPAGSMEIAQVFLRPGCTKIFNSDQGSEGFITDLRMTFVYGDIHKHADDHAPLETPDGIRTQFSTQHYFRANTLDVYINGVLQKLGTDYSEDSSRLGYTFFSPPLSNFIMQHRYIIEHEV